MIDWMDLANIYRSFHPKARRKYIPLMYTWDTLQDISYVLYHETNINSFRKMNII